MRYIHSLLLWPTVGLLVHTAHGEPNPVREQVRTQAQTLANPFRVSLTPEKKQFLAGEPIYLDFRISNSTEQEWSITEGGDYRNQYNRPESFTLTATVADGQAIAELPNDFNMGGMVAAHSIPAHGQYTFKLFLPSWLPLTKPGKYTITATRTLSAAPGKLTFPAFGEAEQRFETTATADVEVLPPDAQKLGVLIRQWGDAMRRGLTGGDKAAAEVRRKLAALNDPRVVPYFAAAVRQKHFEGLEVLGRYNDDEALKALALAFDTGPDDITNTTTHELAVERANQIRYTVALALAQSPHPGAVPLLLKHWNDPYAPVRDTILQRTSKDRIP